VLALPWHDRPAGTARKPDTDPSDTIISVILGLIIALLDTVIQYAINFITM
jgi:hypothetical protein